MDCIFVKNVNQFFSNFIEVNLLFNDITGTDLCPVLTNCHRLLSRCSRVTIRGLSEESTAPAVTTKARHWRLWQTSSSLSAPRWTSTRGSDTRSKAEKQSVALLGLQLASAPKQKKNIFCLAFRTNVSGPGCSGRWTLPEAP